MEKQDSRINTFLFFLGIDPHKNITDPGHLVALHLALHLRQQMPSCSPLLAATGDHRATAHSVAGASPVRHGTKQPPGLVADGC